MQDDVLILDNGASIVENARDLLRQLKFDEAQRGLEQYLRNSPGDIEAIHLLGTALAKQGKYEQAEKLFVREIEIDSTRADAFFNLGLIHTQQNRIEQAAADFESVISLNPNDVQALNDLGAIYFADGQTQKGEELFKKALAANPTFRESFLNLFEILWNSERYAEAVEYAYHYLQALSPQQTASTAPGEVIAAPPQEINEIQKPGAGQLTITRKAPRSIRLSDSETTELFEVHVPPQTRPKKTGMNIAVIADFNIAGQLTQLFRLINEKTIHRARCIIIHEDFLSYDNDIVLSRGNKQDIETAFKIIENADFYHIGRFPAKIGDLDLADYLRPDNSIVQYFGSEIRQNGWQIYNWHKTNKITGLAAWDYTMIKDAPLFYHINIMLDSSKIKTAPRPEGTLKIVHPTTNRNIKKTELFLKTIDRLKEQGCDIEAVLIEGKTNEECLQIKSDCHMTYDQISVGIYGVSAIESMAAGHVVFGGISNFAASYHPDNPIVWVTEDSLEDKIKYYSEHRDEIAERGRAGIHWVKTHHDPNKIICQHLYMYDFVKNGHRFLESPDEQMLRKEL